MPARVAASTAPSNNSLDLSTAAAVHSPTEPADKRLKTDDNEAGATGGGGGSQLAFLVNITVDPKPMLIYPGNTAWQQVFNPTWVAPTPATVRKTIPVASNCPFVCPESVCNYRFHLKTHTKGPCLLGKPLWPPGTLPELYTSEAWLRRLLRHRPAGQLADLG